MRSLLILCLLTACGLDDRTAGIEDATPDPNPLGDAGAIVDGGPSIDSAGLDGGSPPAANDDGLWLTEARGAELAGSFTDGGASSCFDGEENDAEDVADGVDCDDPDCQMLPSCCVNNAACVGAATSLFQTDFVDCRVDSFCGGDFVGFGDPRPSIDADSDTIVLAGDNQYDSGWLGTDAIDLSAERLDVTISFLHAVCTDCLESASVGFTDQTSLSDRSHVMPLVALRAIGARDEMQLVVGDRVAATRPVGDTSTPWELHVLPNGTAQAVHGEDFMEASFAPARDARLVLFGHNVNPSEFFTAGARIDQIAVTRSPTDRVDAWRDHRDLGLRADHTAAARFGGEDLLVLTQGGIAAFYTSASSAAVNWTYDDGPWTATDYTFQVLDSSLVLWARSGSAELTRGVMNVEAQTIGTREVIDISSLGWGDFREPALAFGAEHDILVARVDGRLRVAARTDGGDWFEISGLGELTQGASHPTLTVHDNVFWVHFTRRRGTRDRIHAVVSDQLVFWRDMGVVLAGSAQPGTYDRYSVTKPSVVSDGNELRLYYTGDDLVSQSIGVVRRLSPTRRTRL